MTAVAHVRARVAAVLAATITLCACGATATPLPALVSARGLPLGDVVVQRGGQVLLRLTVEIADTAATQEKGLMGVRHLAADQGEAFVFAPATADGFWMKDTLIPLDIAFVDAQGQVIDVQHMVPCKADPCDVYYARALYGVAVETAAGVLTRAGVRAGDTLHVARRATAASASASG
jgi:uncharacterized membrane protein (UPF0127 family)